MQQTVTIQKKKKTSREKLAEKLKEIFKEHIGFDCGITKQELLYELYGDKISDMTKYQRYWIFNAKIEPVLTWLRKKTKFFIIAQYDANRKKSIFFVVQTLNEFSEYKDKSLRNINGIHNAINRCEKAVLEKWWIKIQNE